MNTFGRVAVCGAISQYNLTEPPKFRPVSGLILLHQLKVEGFNVTRWLSKWPDAFKELAQWIQEVRQVDTLTFGMLNRLSLIPYSGKLLREKIFVNCMVKNMLFAEKTSVDCSLLLSQMTPRPKFCGDNFCYSHKTTKFIKVFSLKSFPLYGSSHVSDFSYSIASQ